MMTPVSTMAAFKLTPSPAETKRPTAMIFRPSSITFSGMPDHANTCRNPAEKRRSRNSTGVEIPARCQRRANNSEVNRHAGTLAAYSVIETRPYV